MQGRTSVGFPMLFSGKGHADAEMKVSAIGISP